MTDRRRTYISSVMATKTSGASPDERRKYGEVTLTNNTDHTAYRLKVSCP